MNASDRPRRLLTIGHSYCVTLNRRLAHEIARAGNWDVTVVGPAKYRGDFRRHILEAGAGEPCHVVPVPVHLARRPHTMIYGRRLMKLLAEPWDVIHCWEEPYVAAAAQVAWLASPETPLVFATFQNLEKQYPPPFNWIEQYVTKRANGIVAFGRTAAEVLERKAWGSAGRPKIEPPPIAIIPPGVDTGRFRPDDGRRAETLEELGWRPGPPVIGFVGRFVPEKGIPFLTSVLDDVRLPWRALFVGSGPLEPTLREWSSRYGDRIRIVTTAPHDGVPAYLNAMDLLCAPSETTPHWKEQFGRMLIEAFASGVPVVASDSGEIPYVLDQVGVLVRERDRATWCQAIESLIENAARRCELGKLGRTRAESAFAWRSVAERHLEFFDRLIANRKAQA